jgi:hypothetical protein
VFFFFTALTKLKISELNNRSGYFSCTKFCVYLFYSNTKLLDYMHTSTDYSSNRCHRTVDVTASIKNFVPVLRLGSLLKVQWNQITEKFYNSGLNTVDMFSKRMENTKIGF